MKQSIMGNKELYGSKIEILREVIWGGGIVGEAGGIGVNFRIKQTNNKLE